MQRHCRGCRYTIVDELEEVRRNGSRVAEYRYDALGRRDANRTLARDYIVFDAKPGERIDTQSVHAAFAERATA